MAVSVTMPALGESVTEGTITRWLKQEGETVEADEPLLEVSTDKVDTEIPAPASGVLLRIVAAEDDTVEVGAELATIGDPSEASGGSAGAAPASAPAPAAQPQAAEAAPSAEAPAAPTAPPAPSASSAPSAPSGEPATPPAATGGAASAGTPVLLPALGESVTEGTVTRWLKQEGDTVEADEPLLEVSTDKVDTEIPAPASGVLTRISVQEDETVEVGAELAVIGGAPAQAAPTAPPAPEPAAAPQAPAPQQAQAPEPAPQAQPTRDDYSGPGPEVESAQGGAAAPAAPAPAPSDGAASTASDGTASEPAGGAEAGSPYVTPLVRKLASQHGVDLSTVTGTGVGGRIRKQDVLEAAEQARSAQQAQQPAPDTASSPADQTPLAEPVGSPANPAAAAAGPAANAPAPSPLRGRTEKMSRLRKVIAQRMVESLQTSAQLTTVVEVDVTRIARLRQRAKAEFERREGVRLSFLPFFALAAVEALKQHPAVNAQIDLEAGEITYHDAEHLGIAVDTERGLLVPVVRDAGDLNLGGLSRKIADLAERTRSNKVGPDELSGGTFTLTNTGSRGALFDTPILNQPQVAILGTGSVVKRPVVVSDAELGDVVAIRSMVYLALTYDHRLVDGADAARFLVAVKSRLEEGAFEADLGM